MAHIIECTRCGERKTEVMTTIEGRPIHAEVQTQSIVNQLADCFPGAIAKDESHICMTCWQELAVLVEQWWHNAEL